MRQMSAHSIPISAPNEFVKMSPRLVSRPGIQSWSTSTVIVVTNRDRECASARQTGESQTHSKRNEQKHVEDRIENRRLTA